MPDLERTLTVFAGHRRLATGHPRLVLRATKQYVDGDCSGAQVLVFDDATGQQVEFDLEGTLEQALSALETDPDFAERPRKVGRPRLGVVSREISLLPRHWEWLERQPSGASAALRKLVEHASRSGRQRDEARRAREAAAKFMWNIAGDLPGFEEASRALYARDDGRLSALLADWPTDVRVHVQALLASAVGLEAAAEAAAREAKADPAKPEIRDE